MASIQKLDNGWRYRVSYKENGQYKTKTKGGFRTKKEAELAAAEISNKLNKGHDINAGDQLFSEYIRNWFEIYKKNKHSLSHEKNIELSVELAEQYFIGVKIKDINRDMYQKFLNSISEKYAYETVRKRHTYIKSCLKYAIEDGVIFRDPTYKAIVHGKKTEKLEEVKYLNFEDVKRLIEKTQKNLNPKYISKYMILFAIATGARFAEILGMTWDCIDFDEQTVTINKTWDYKEKNDFAETKNYQSRRTITIDKNTCEIMRDLKKYQSEHALKTNLRNKKNLCFVNNKMQLISNNAVNKTLKSLCDSLHLKRITCHSLRHTHASMMLYKGVNIKYISKRLGHKDIVMTLQTYSHILDEMEQKESRQIDQTMLELYNVN